GTALVLEDLADLTATRPAVSVERFAGSRHAALSAVQTALTQYRMTPAGDPPSVPHLAHRLDQAWRVRHSSPDHRTQLGILLPDLIRDAQEIGRASCRERV